MKTLRLCLCLCLSLSLALLPVCMRSVYGGEKGSVYHAQTITDNVFKTCRLSQKHLVGIRFVLVRVQDGNTQLGAHHFLVVFLFGEIILHNLVVKDSFFLSRTASQQQGRRLTFRFKQWSVEVELFYLLSVPACSVMQECFQYLSLRGSGTDRCPLHGSPFLNAMLTWIPHTGLCLSSLVPPCGCT